MWSLHETLLEASTPSDKDENSLRKVLRSIASFGMLGGLVLMLKNFMPQVQDVVAPRRAPMGEPSLVLIQSSKPQQFVKSCRGYSQKFLAQAMV
jgi:hypothetical protein